ncbi:MAG: DUF3108 domain-containing protein [Proteobacteria bacterium]|nr:DUF3108 domain-containing protein [Pseudomonadota bacterium]MDA1301205.1 DUF3108 domain-containing protein [Pseudomonadota bacterium]
MLALVVMPLASSAAPAGLTPFKAEYRANFKGLPVSATGIRELRSMPEGRYHFSSTARSLFASVSETTLFEWEGGPVPVHYEYIRKGIGKNRQDLIAFDHPALVATYRDQNHVIGPGTLDKLSYQIRMRADLLQAYQSGSQWPDMHYEVADRGQLRQYDFAVVGESEVDTPVGRFKTIEATRVRQDDDRTTTFWMAPEYEFMLIQFEQTEANGKVFSLLLKQAEFDGRPVRGSNRQ